MGRGRKNRSEMANQGAFTNICARIPISVWSMIDNYARLNTGQNRSRALELMLKEWQRWDDEVSEEVKERKAAAFEAAKKKINAELRIE